MKAVSFLTLLLPFLLSVVTPLMAIRPISFLIIEKVSNFAHQERLTGVNRVVFLVSTIFYDFFLFLLHVVFYIGGCLVSDSKLAGEYILLLIGLPLLAFLSGELIILLFYRLFSTRAKGFALILLLLMISDIISFVASFIMSLIDFKYNTNSAEQYPHLFLSPMMTALAWNKCKLPTVGMIISRNYEMRKCGMNITGPLYIILHFLILLIILVLIELRIWRMCRRRDTQIQPAAIDGTEGSLVLRVNNLRKWYGRGATRKNAVNGITFGVRAHEGFGVLGINGAGKTSTFEMLTGNTLPSGGLATVGGVDCSRAPTIGYCPQADALMEDLTGRQSLVILAALHGYENPRNVANIVITCVGMQDHADKKTGNYSGGQRRKISVAASLLAQNSLIILDEPTAGIDPIARRDIWSVICALRESTNTAIVLTSHSMDEVKALVSNLIILRDGSIVVEGSPQMIKNQFGGHYSFNIVLENMTNVAEVTNQIRSVFPSASLYDSASIRNIKYRIPRLPSDVFSSLFEKASNIAEKLKATSFCFTQATLEDAFMLAATAPIPEGAAVAAPNGVAAVPTATPDTVPAPPPSTVPTADDEKTVTGATGATTGA